MRPFRPRGSSISRRCRRRCRRRRRWDSRRRRRSATSRSTPASTAASRRRTTTSSTRSSAGNCGTTSPLEAAYVGRRGHNLLIRRDLAMPLNLVDPKSGVNYFQAAGQAINAYKAAGITGPAPAKFTAIAPIPYWENLFPGAAGTVSGVALTATQRMTRLFFQNDPDFSSAIFYADSAARRRAASSGRTRSSTVSSRTWRRRARSRSANYDSMQLTLRKRWSRGYQFDVNYTLSESKDLVRPSSAARSAWRLFRHSVESVHPGSPVLVFGFRRPPPGEPELGRRPAVRTGRRFGSTCLPG